MAAILQFTPTHDAMAEQLDRGLSRVQVRFNQQLDSAIEPVAALCRYLERYRGKLLRPTLTLVSGLCAAGRDDDGAITDAHITIAAVVEMIHMATLVHDDVLDEAAIRRGGQTVNALAGNEAAVILGDYLISRSFHLCSQLDTQATALRIGEITSTVCEGELLQLHHRGNFELDERTYFQIIERKTAALIGVSCEMGARHSSAPDDAGRLFEYGRRLGLAFQIQDDLLDVVGDEDVVGKPLGRDLEKGKLTLPVIHHLSATSDREASLEVLRGCGTGRTSRAEVRDLLESTSSLTLAEERARKLVGEARALLEPFAATTARSYLLALADAVVSRNR